jgi:gluconokinase
MILILMGVAGSGKTTIGTLLSEAIGWKFFDGDDFHPEENIERMRRHDLVRELNHRGESAILAFSALRRAYRERVADGIDEFRYVYLNGDPALLKQRVKEREGHYFGADLLESQFETLEEPEGITMVDVAGEPEEVVARVQAVLGV